MLVAHIALSSCSKVQSHRECPTFIRSVEGCDRVVGGDVAPPSNSRSRSRGRALGPLLSGRPSRENGTRRSQAIRPEAEAPGMEEDLHALGTARHRSSAGGSPAASLWHGGASHHGRRDHAHAGSGSWPHEGRLSLEVDFVISRPDTSPRTMTRETPGPGPC